MRWGKRGQAARGYHHGNLKEALVRAALELIAEKGPAGFTFAAAARWAGVSPAAPYRHFRDRDELLIDVARRGFDRFAVTLESAWDRGRPDAFTAFHRLGKAYLRFARSEPRITGSGAACLCRVAHRDGAAHRDNACAAASPSPDDDIACLGTVAWH